MSNRIQDAGEIERRLLELAHTTDAKITAPALAYFAPCSIDDASRVLDDLAAHDRVDMDIEDDGTIVYHLRGRQKIAAPTLSRALVPAVRPPGPSPLLAAALSAVIPGAGHVYAGRVVAAVLWFIVVGLGYVLILPGLVLHLFSMVSAAAAARQIEASRARYSLGPAAAHF